MRKLSSKTRWYKVLGKDGQSIHGGKMTWSLPTDGRPGEWHSLDNDKPLLRCLNGFHLTNAPRLRWSPGDRVFLAEPRGVTLSGRDHGDELVCREARLVRELVGDELEIAINGESVAWATLVAPRAPRRQRRKRFSKVLYALLDNKGECELKGGRKAPPLELPTSMHPGPWCDLPTEDPCVPMQSGFQLVTDVLAHYGPSMKVYIAQAEGPIAVLGTTSGDVVAARRVRLVRRIAGDELDALTCKASAGPLSRTKPKKTVSPGAALVEHVRLNMSSSVRDSRIRYDHALDKAAKLGIEAGLKFLNGDFRSDLEVLYRVAVESRNESACRALEKQVGRGKFVAGGARLAVGSTFRHNGATLSVTSFHSADTLIACEHRYEKSRRVVVRRIKITSAELRAAEKTRLAALHERKKAR